MMFAPAGLVDDVPMNALFHQKAKQEVDGFCEHLQIDANASRNS
jgi:hypothetical protein